MRVGPIGAHRLVSTGGSGQTRAGPGHWGSVEVKCASPQKCCDTAITGIKNLSGSLVRNQNTTVGTNHFSFGLGNGLNFFDLVH